MTRTSTTTRTKPRFMESPFSFFRMHCDHEPVRIPLNRPPGTFSPTGGEGWDEGVRFMERENSRRRERRSGGRTPLQSAFEDFTQLFRSEFNRIGLHAASLQSRRDNRRLVVGGNSVAMEWQYFQVRTEVLHPDNSFSGARAIPADDQPRDVVVTTQRLAVGRTLAQSNEVGLHHMGQQRGAHGAVWCGKHAADG